MTRTELLYAGITLDQIRRRLRAGALLIEYRGVYRVGHRAPSVEARYLAAVRACGEGALLSGRAAGHLLGVLKGRPPPPEVVTRTERAIKGIITSRCRRLDRRDAMSFNSIPCTTVARTLVDLAAVLSEDELARACHEAGVRYRTTPRHIRAVLARRPSSPGAQKLWRVVSGAAPVTLSALERRFIALLKREGLPLPQTNRVAGSHRVDCRWPEHGLTVELDSYRFHNSCSAWEQSYEREREAHARGDQFRRYTWGDVTDDPRRMLRELRRLLAP